MSKEMELLKSKIFAWRKASGKGPLKLPDEIRRAVGALETEMNLGELATVLGLGSATIFRCRKEFERTRENRSEKESAPKGLTSSIPKATKVFVGGAGAPQQIPIESARAPQSRVVATMTIGKAKIDIFESESLLALCSRLMKTE